MTNNTERWKPAVTVAAIIEDQGRYLLVEEETPEGLQLNNPAGHLDPGESPLEGVVRETLEESGRHFTAEALLGIYMARFVRPAQLEDVTYLRLAFVGRVSTPVPGWVLDKGIVRTVWMSLEEVRASAGRHRSPLVLQCIEDHRSGRRLPLEALQIDPSLYAPRVKS